MLWFNDNKNDTRCVYLRSSDRPLVGASLTVLEQLDSPPSHHNSEWMEEDNITNWDLGYTSLKCIQPQNNIIIKPELMKKKRDNKERSALVFNVWAILIDFLFIHKINNLFIVVKRVDNLNCWAYRDIGLG